MSPVVGMLPYLMRGVMEPVEDDSYQSLNEMMLAKLAQGDFTYRIEAFEKCWITCWSEIPGEDFIVDQILWLENLPDPVVQVHTGKIVSFVFPGVIKNASVSGKSGFRIRKGKAGLNFEAFAQVSQLLQISGGGILTKNTLSN